MKIIVWNIKTKWMIVTWPEYMVTRWNRRYRRLPYRKEINVGYTTLRSGHRAVWGFSLREKSLMKPKRSWTPFFYRTTFDDAFFFLAPSRICSGPNASRRFLIALSFWVWCRRGKPRLILYLTCLPSLDLLIYPADSRSEVIFLTVLSVIPINPDNSRPVINWCLARRKNTIAWFVRNAHLAILMPCVILNRIFETPHEFIT